jgi:hypothetical protein
MDYWNGCGTRDILKDLQQEQVLLLTKNDYELLVGDKLMEVLTCGSAIPKLKVTTLTRRPQSSCIISSRSEKKKNTQTLMPLLLSDTCCHAKRVKIRAVATHSP